MVGTLEWRKSWASGVKADCQVPPPQHPTYDLKQVIQLALEEDAGGVGDVTTLSTVPADTQARATFTAKSDGVVAGLGVVDLVFEAVDPTLRVQWSVQDGGRVKYKQVFGTVTGKAASILVAERVALNFMQRMSGIATMTSAMVEAAQQGGPAKILDTRKTAPGMRLTDKWAVLLGGGHNHRMGLFDMLMIKDNHIAAAGGILPAVHAAQDYMRTRGMKLGIEVEANTLAEVLQVLQLLEDEPDCMITRLMLDNMTTVDASCPGGIDVGMLRQGVELVDGRVDTEASGNVTLDTVAYVAATGVTYISSGQLTHSVKCLDISMNIETD